MNSQFPPDTTFPPGAESETGLERSLIPAIMDTAGALILVIDREGRIVRFNRGCEQTTGYTAGEMRGRFLWDTFLAPEEVEQVKAMFGDLRAGHSRSRFENHWLTRDGGRRLIAWSASALAGLDGDVEWVISVGVDITDHKQAEEALRESQAQLSSVIASAMDAIITVNDEQRIVIFNAAAEQMFGCPAAEAIGQPLDRFVPERFRRAHSEHVRGFGQTNVSKRSMGSLGAIYGLRTDGEEFPIEASISQIEVGGQKLFTVILRDITERKRADDRFRLAVESAPNAMVMVNQQGQIILVNSQTERLFGYTRQELIGQSVEMLVPTRFHHRHPGYRAGFASAPQTRAMGAGRDLYGLRKDGSEVPIEIGLNPIEAEGEVLVLSSIVDITGRKRAEAQLREQAALLDHAQDAILVQDLADRILFWNRRAERIYGWTGKEAAGRDVRELLHQENAANFTRAKQAVVSNGEWIGELHQVTKDGREIIAECHWTLVRDDADGPKSILAINTDITAKKKLEAQFLRAQRMESIGTLAGGIAHDLNNVLSPVLTAINLLQIKITDPESRRLIQILQTNIERGADMVRQVLTFARGVEGERIMLQPKHLIREVVKILRETLPKAIEIRIALPDDLWVVTGDATQLYQVLMNLCVNARDAMPGGGALTISAENLVLDDSYARMHLEANPGRFVLIRITDTGVGIPAENLNKVFEPFFTTKEYGKGTGLGLSTVVGIVKSHQGFVDVYSEINRGTEFKVYLPAVTSEMMQQAEAEQAELPAGHGELVLLVDDEAAIREITRGTLEAYGYNVMTAADGTEAVAIYAANKDSIQVVLTDMMMPYMDGPATIRALRKMDPRVRIIASSGLAADGKLAEAANTGVKMFLSKPYTAEKLLKALAEVLRD